LLDEGVTDEPVSNSTITYKTICAEWAEELEALEHAVFSDIDTEDLYDATELTNLANGFPEGNFVAFDGDRIVGMGLGLLVEFDFEHTDHTLRDITGDDGVKGHHPDHPWYYGTDISVLKSHRGHGIGRGLYDLRKQFVREQNKRGIVAGGVIPGYAEHRDTMTAKEYISRVSAGELRDPTLTMQINNGFRAAGAIPGYVHDETVGNWASLIVWDNPEFQP